MKKTLSFIFLTFLVLSAIAFGQSGGVVFPSLTVGTGGPAAAGYESLGGVSLNVWPAPWTPIGNLSANLTYGSGKLDINNQVLLWLSGNIFPTGMSVPYPQLTSVPGNVTTVAVGGPSSILFLQQNGVYGAPAGTIFNGGNISNILYDTNVTDSTTTISGSIVTAGGLGVAKQEQIGGLATFDGNLTSGLSLPGSNVGGNYTTANFVYTANTTVVLQNENLSTGTGAVSTISAFAPGSDNQTALWLSAVPNTATQLGGLYRAGSDVIGAYGSAGLSLFSYSAATFFAVGGNQPGNEVMILNAGNVTIGPVSAIRTFLNGNTTINSGYSLFAPGFAVNGNLTTVESNTVSFTNATLSTSSTSGALVVTGGIGVSGNSTFGGNLSLGGVSINTWPSSAAFGGRQVLYASNNGTGNLTISVSGNYTIFATGFAGTSSVTYSGSSDDYLSFNLYRTNNTPGVIANSSTTTLYIYNNSALSNYSQDEVIPLAPARYITSNTTDIITVQYYWNGPDDDPPISWYGLIAVPSN